MIKKWNMRSGLQPGLFSLKPVMPVFPYHNRVTIECEQGIYDV